MIKPPQEKDVQEDKVLSEEAFQTAEERGEVKGKGERERQTQLNAEFQRIAKRGKKAFLNEQCKEMEENNIMGKPRYIFKKIGDIKGTFHIRMGMIKDRNDKDLTEDLTEAEEIKRWWQEYTEKLYKKDLNDPDNHDGMIAHPEPDIQECETKCALGSITRNKAS